VYIYIYICIYVYREKVVAMQTSKPLCKRIFVFMYIYMTDCNDRDNGQGCAEKYTKKERTYAYIYI